MKNDWISGNRGLSGKIRRCLPLRQANAVPAVMNLKVRYQTQFAASISFFPVISPEPLRKRSLSANLKETEADPFEKRGQPTWKFQ